MTIQSVCYSAPGRVILSGEHSVMYGKPTLSCAIDKRLAITFTQAKKTAYKDAVMPILEKTAVEFLNRKNIKTKNTSYTYSIESTIPIGRGLGSSAAYCACISAGLLELFTGDEWSKEEINMCAYQMEKHFHKNSSGVDTSTSIMGGLIYYRKEFEFLKTISGLQIRIPKHFIETLELIDSGKPSETMSEMEKVVGMLFNKESSKMEEIFNEMEKITKRMVVSIMKEDTTFFKENMWQNQKLLEQIGIVSEQTKKLLLSLKKMGKGMLVGNGGIKNASGYFLFFMEDADRCRKTLDERMIQHMSFVPSYKGLVREKVRK